MCKVSKSKPLVLKIELERDAMESLLNKLAMAGVEIPKAGLALKFSGKKAVLSIGIHKDTYEKVLNVIIGYTMVYKSLEGLGDAFGSGDIKSPSVDFNGIHIAGAR